ncbi:MAG: sugar transporter [Chlorobi bacterium]|nr:sugar transporter [Chlorobiota bacterium]
MTTNMLLHISKNRFLVFILFIVFFSSCIPQKETVYLQDHSNKKDYKNPYKPYTSITDKYFLKPNDYLYIHVRTPDSKLSEFFNQTSTTNGSTNTQNNKFFYYLIDDSMNIDFPYVGKINLKGCNIFMAKDTVKKALKPFLKEADLIVKLATNFFTVLGEVRNPGVINMNKDQITIFEAFAMAGDIRPFGKKKQIKLVRQTLQGEKTYLIDITDKNIVNSEFYYIYPNDLLYVRPMKAKMWGIGESFSIGIITSVLALGLTLSTFIK